MHTPGRGGQVGVEAVDDECARLREVVVRLAERGDAVGIEDRGEAVGRRRRCRLPEAGRIELRLVDDDVSAERLARRHLGVRTTTRHATEGESVRHGASTVMSDGGR